MDQTTVNGHITREVHLLAMKSVNGDNISLMANIQHFNLNISNKVPCN